MFDFIIVGQGLAGSVLAYTLIKRGFRILVFNTARRNTASHVAAGLYNPITGRKMVKTWMADELFPYLESFYRQVEAETGTKFLHKKPIYRPFLNIEEQNDWMGRSGNNQFTPYVQQIARESIYGADVHDPYGGLVLKNAGYLDIPLFTESIRHLLVEQNSYLQETFYFSKLKIKDTEVEYDRYKARKVVCCDGTEGNNNPYFEWLPFTPVKGELLHIVTEKPLEMIYNRGVFVLPTPAYCKVGATYDHHELSDQITAKARSYLLEKLSILLKTPYKVINQVAGIRPATQDRRPFVGLHPVLKPLAIFNGLGTKGVSLAPYFASQMADLLSNGMALTQEVDISRYYRFYTTAIK